MRNFRLRLGIVATSVLLGCGLRAPAFAADAKAAALLAREHKCLEQTTVDAEMECYDPSEALVLYDADTPREFDGAAAVRANFAPAYDDIKNPKYNVSEEHAEVVGKLGYTFGIVHFTGTDKSGKPIDVTWRTTNLWRNEGGVWKIFHEHNSFPVDMTSGKADMQSK